MSLLWRRATIAGFVLIALLALISAALAWPEPTLAALALLACALMIGGGALLLYDGRRIGHVALFTAASTLVAGALTLHSPLPLAIAAAGLGTFTLGAGWFAWFTRERERQPQLADYYAAAVRARRIRENDAQLEVLNRLDTLAEAFRRYERRRRMPWAFLLRQPRGIYLHGPAGQGKSFLLDAMFDTLPSRAKHRFHFHDLMSQLTSAANAQSGRDFRKIARGLATRASLVLIDEVNVLDPGTGVLFMRLVSALWRIGCVVCISSNQSPQQLFKGVKLPAAELGRFFDELPRYADEQRLEAGEDYRLQKLAGSDLYQHPIHPRTPQRLERILDLLAESRVERSPIPLEGGRSLDSVAHAQGIAWFNFRALCDTPLSYRDYLTLVDRFPNLIVSEVPMLDEEDPARRFAWLVEILYDRRKRLILSAHAPLHELFAPGLSSTGNEVDFIKIRSRLAEMQSSEYDYSLV